MITNTAVRASVIIVHDHRPRPGTATVSGIRKANLRSTVAKVGPNDIDAVAKYRLIVRSEYGNTTRKAVGEVRRKTHVIPIIHLDSAANGFSPVGRPDNL